MDKIIIEARVNELAPRDENPNVPFLPDDIIRDAQACYEAGASIIHYHGRTTTGEPDHDPVFYQTTNSGIRDACPILIHPTLGYVAHGGDARERFDAVEESMKDPKTAPHFAPMDTGSVNVDWWDPEKNAYDTTGLVYENSTETLMYFADRIKHHGLKHYLVSWNVSFTRQMEALLKMGVIPEPAFVLLCMTDGISLSGHPGTPEGLDAHTTFLPKDKNVVWSAMNYKGNLLLLTEKVIKSGGHISIGLGDYPYTELGQPTNADIIAEVVKQARALGREVATIDDTRAMLGMTEGAAAAA
jgi:3-keto-5-aminohexanoate cleavage enzyme